MVFRVIRGYRTVCVEAAYALAGITPWDLEAEILAEMYFQSIGYSGYTDTVSPRFWGTHGGNELTKKCSRRWSAVWKQRWLVFGASRVGAQLSSVHTTQWSGRDLAAIIELNISLSVWSKLLSAVRERELRLHSSARALSHGRRQRSESVRRIASWIRFDAGVQSGAGALIRIIIESNWIEISHPQMGSQSWATFLCEDIVIVSWGYRPHPGDKWFIVPGSHPLKWSCTKKGTSSVNDKFHWNWPSH